MSDFDNDDLVLQELKNQNIEGLTPRCLLAIRQLAEKDEGEAIFLFISMNSRLRELEAQLSNCKNEATQH